MSVRFLVNVEVRPVPAGWRHPEDARGRPLPLVSRAYWNACEPGSDDRASCAGAVMPDTAGLPPEKICIAAYETISEGTPISPTFPDTLDGRMLLAIWCARNRTIAAGVRAVPSTWAAALFTDMPLYYTPGVGVTFTAKEN